MKSVVCVSGINHCSRFLFLQYCQLPRDSPQNPCPRRNAQELGPPMTPNRPVVVYGGGCLCGNQLWQRQNDCSLEGLSFRKLEEMCLDCSGY